MSRRRRTPGGRWALRVVAAVLVVLALPAAWAAAAHAGTLSGTVRAQDGGEPPVALAGATVTASEPGGGAPVATTTSDPLGGYLLALADGDYDVEVAAPGREPVVRRGVAVGGAAQLDATLVPTGYGRLFGTVVDSDGDPVPGVEVRFGSASPAIAVGDADGRFSLAAPRSTGPQTLLMTGGSSAESWNVRAYQGTTLGSEREIALRVPAMTTLTARVLGRDDVPLEGMPTYLPGLRLTADLGGGVTATISNDVRSGRTDANGEFSGQVIDQGTLTGLAQQLAVYPPPETLYFQLSIPPPPVNGPTVATMRLTKYGTLALHLRGADGAPLRAAVWTDPSGYTDGADVDLRGAEGSAPTVSVSPRRPNDPTPDPRPWQFDSDPFAFEGVQSDTLRLPPWAPSAVRVVDEQGDPVVGAVVTAPEMVVDPGTRTLTGTLRTYGTRARTGPDGRVSFDTFAGARTDPAAPGLVVPPAGSGLDERRYAIETAGETTTVVLAERIVHVDGTLADADGRPVAGATVTADDGTSATTLADGSFAFDVLSGTTGIDIRRSDFLVEGASIVFEDDTRLALRLPGRVRLTVRVTGDGGSVLPGAVVTVPFRTAEGAAIGSGLTADVSTYGRSATTDAAGEAVFGLFVDSYGNGGIDVRGPEGSEYGDRIVPLAAIGADRTIDVRLLSPATTPPRIWFAPSGAGGSNNGWWTASRVGVTVTAYDSDAVASLACSVDGVARTLTQRRTPTSIAGGLSVSGEGRHLVACTAADVLGNVGEGTRDVWIDRSDPAAPTVSASRPADSDNGWWRDRVTVEVSGNGDPQLADGSAGSGVDPVSVPEPRTFTASGAHVVRARVADVAGNLSAPGRTTVRVDADPPTTTVTCPARTLRPGQPATARWVDADGESGLAGSAQGTIALDTATVGPHRIIHSAYDRVGHLKADECWYSVEYPFDWRGGLVDAPARNAVPAGATTVPLRFSLGGDHGLDVLDWPDPTVMVINCVTDVPRRVSDRSPAFKIALPGAW